MFLLEPPPGFQGLHPDRPITFSKRHLPHWHQAGATYFLTFRLADSIPVQKLQELKRLREEWEKKHALSDTTNDSEWQELAKAMHARVERWLDAGMGACQLRDSSNAKLVGDALQHFDGDRYEIACSVVMPNHVHLIVRPYDEDDVAISRISHSWKRPTAREINKRIKRSGTLWQDESYDRIIRDSEHLWRVIQYIGKNPSKCGMDAKSCRLWISPRWEQLGWRFETK